MQTRGPNLYQNYQKLQQFCYYIWIHHEKWIQISTNMPSIGLVIPAIPYFLRKKQKQKLFMWQKQWPCTNC